MDKTNGFVGDDLRFLSRHNFHIFQGGFGAKSISLGKTRGLYFPRARKKVLPLENKRFPREKRMYIFHIFQSTSFSSRNGWKFWKFWQAYFLVPPAEVPSGRHEWVKE